MHRSRVPPVAANVCLDIRNNPSELMSTRMLTKDLPPDFKHLRTKLFHLAHRLANLPEQTREQLSRPNSKYLFGWSHGKEVMNGVSVTRMRLLDLRRVISSTTNYSCPILSDMFNGLMAETRYTKRLILC